MSQISKFYAGRSVFITGGSGFVGKQLVEKLLRSCPQVDRIFLLMRPKKGCTPHERLQQTLASPVFDVLRESQPTFSQKVVPVIGDVRNDHLGLSDSDFQQLNRSASVFIHSAATLSFTEPLSVAVDMNVLGVRRALNIAKQLPHLQAMVHISTGYSQVDKQDEVIEEKVYDPPIRVEKLIEMTRLLNEDELQKLTPHLLETSNRPNTYTLTKAAAEKLVDDEREHVPVCIVRPTIIAASRDEPFPGWVDNFTAASGILAGFGTSIIRVVRTKSSKRPCKLDIIPVDKVANAILATAWKTASTSDNSSSSPVPVYNITAGDTHLVETTTTNFLKQSRRYPYSGVAPTRFSITGYPAYTSNEFIYKYVTEYYTPAKCYLIDTFLSLTGQKPSMMKLYGNTKVLLDVLRYFTTHEFTWSNKNLRTLFEKDMNKLDRELFDVDVRLKDFSQYYTVWWNGMRQYAFKDKAYIKQLQQQRQRQQELATEQLARQQKESTVQQLRTDA
jgi:fatty acyl-CoA reductase